MKARSSSVTATAKSFGTRLLDLLKKTSIEPYMFLVMFALNVSHVTLQSLLHDRACRVSLNFSSEICNDLENEENEREQLAAVSYGNNLYTAVLMIATLPSVVMATFLGPWSDKYNRKYPLILATIGTVIDFFMQAVIAYFPTASPYWFLASASVSGLSGGIVIIMSSTYSYMSDITNERSRQSRFAVLEFFSIMSGPLGSFIGGQVFEKGGYLPVMFISPGSLFLALMWAIFYVKETKERQKGVTMKEMFMDLFRFDNIKESFRTCMKKRSGNFRLQIWLLLFIGFSTRLTEMGALSIGFSYTRKVFKWTVTQYSNMNTIMILLKAAATLGVVPYLNQKLLVHEAAVGLIGILSLMFTMTLMSVTVSEWLVYYAWFGGMLIACGNIAVRSRISKLVNRMELGRVFSLLATCEALTPVLGTTCMLQLYNWSASFYPGLPYAIAAVFLIPSALIFIWMMGLPTMSFTQYEENEATRMKEMEERCTRNVT
ncbi:proton-coupled folate transporter-like isoform X1 [Stegodyphus dumicola]|uniref:proton-coupled folate transporter-like isoform X1 n=2 Tax=Stegodyphus dumicola TaxID=202533 RepID=UPI0015A9AAAD|nr:proton-coupled folate transporter-like isoform X1 [Stegodyphus dumicola]XP_035213560.1 proton-coupled folate transporter-like isoform X1 [Stegodyphus dumicola]